MEPLTFQDTKILVYRLFDVADEIELDRAQERLAGAATRLKLSRERSRYLEIPRAPLTVDLGQRELVGASRRVFFANAHARLFSFGALSIRYDLTLGDLDSGTAASLIRDFEGSRDLEAAARGEALKLCERLAPALDDPHDWDGVETYAVLFAGRILGCPSASAAAHDARIARVLLADDGKEPLSGEEVRDATQHRFSYTENDLCVIDWNAAVVIEPDGSRDIPDILEFASAQLLEFRFYDDLVDREMEGLYSILALKREPIHRRLGGRYRRLARQLNRRLIETVEFVERVDNAIKVIADTYLARVYLAALHTFRVADWQAGVNRKQDLTRQIAEVLSNESQASRSDLLEVVIILLILFEIVAPLLKQFIG